MTAIMKNSCRHLGTLQGSGSLSVGDSSERLGNVTFEIDGYADRDRRWANGEIEGEAVVLDRAFAAGVVRLASTDGVSLDLVLQNPAGGSTAEFDVKGQFPL